MAIQQILELPTVELKFKRLFSRILHLYFNINLVSLIVFSFTFQNMFLGD